MVQSELVAIFNELLGQKARLRKNGSQATYHCPFCTDRNLVTQKLELAIAGPRMGSYHCWRCDTKGQSFGSLLKKLDAPPSARQAVFKLTGDIRLARHQNVALDASVVRLPPEFKPLAVPKTTPEYKNALAYVKRRGLTREDILRYNVGYCEDGPYEHHIIIPSYDAKGVLNFFIGRRYYDTVGTIPHKKPDVPMSDIIGFECFVNWNEPVVLVEGVFNAITIRKNAIPLFGKYPSKKLLETLHFRHVKKVYVCLDSDADGDAFKLCQRLFKREGIPSYFVHLVGGKDANEIGFHNVWSCIRSAIEIDDTILLAKEQGRDIYSL